MIVKELINHNNIVLHNIDHHHDICYKDWQIPDIKKGCSYSRLLGRKFNI